jgi:ATP-dependent protease HslVU (ClpYQ) peptidase subunit
VTTICAVRDGKRTWIGSDTLGSREGLRAVCGHKWVRFGAWAIGHSGDLRALNIMRHHAKRLLDDLDEPFEFTARLMDVLRDCDYDLSAHKGQHTPCTGQSLILANPGNVWRLCDTLSFSPNEHYWADGSGQEYALGAMFAMREIKDAERVLRAGLAAAMEYDAGTGGEIWTDVLQ